MNQLFWETLSTQTHYPFELIVVDNHSNDGSAEYFESVGATVLRQKVNHCYPVSQNIGIAAAKGEVLAFLNNDIIVCPQWDHIMLASMEKNQLDVATACGLERMESLEARRQLRRRWRVIKQLVSLFGRSRSHLETMHRWMYPNWKNFCANRRQLFQHQILLGFVGNTVMMTRRGLSVLGPWDERIQGADFDLYLRSAIRARDVGDIKPCHIILDCFIHHYIRLSFQQKYPPFAEQDSLLALDQKYKQEDLDLLRLATDTAAE